MEYYAAFNANFISTFREKIIGPILNILTTKKSKHHAVCWMNIYKLSNTTLHVVIKNYTPEIETIFLIYIKAISQIISKDIIALTVTVLNRFILSGQQGYSKLHLCN
jgi:hypothetical protein